MAAIDTRHLVLRCWQSTETANCAPIDLHVEYAGTQGVRSLLVSIRSTA